MSYLERHIAPASGKPSSRAPLLASSTYRSKGSRITGAIACQPRQTSSSSSEVAALRHDLRDVLEVEASLLARRAVLALAVDSFQRGGDPRELFALDGVCRGGQRQGVLQELLLARQVRRQRQAVEPRGLLGVVRGCGDQPLVGLRGEDLRVVGDVGQLDPGGAARVDRQREQLRLCIFEKRPRLLDGRLRARGLAHVSRSRRTGGTEVRLETNAERGPEESRPRHASSLASRARFISGAPTGTSGITSGCLDWRIRQLGRPDGRSAPPAGGSCRCRAIGSAAAP